jgi:hypothetical protein
MSVMCTQVALGAFYRRLAVRIGKAKVLTATARKLALLIYRVLSGKLVYQDADATAYQVQRRAPRARTQVPAQTRQVTRP